jgi:hypothetical protein
MGGWRGDSGRKKKKGGNDGQLSVAAIEAFLVWAGRPAREPS